MRRIVTTLAVFVLLFSAGSTWANDWKDSIEAYKSGDYATSLRVWREYAGYGEPNALHNLGVLYYEGKGVSKDFVKTYIWWSLASALGHEDAARKLESFKKLMTSAAISQAQAQIQAFSPVLASLNKANNSDSAIHQAIAIVDMSKAIENMEEALAKLKKVEDTVSEEDSNEINPEDSKIIFATESGYEIPFSATQNPMSRGVQDYAAYKNSSDFLQVVFLRFVGGDYFREAFLNLNKFKKSYNIEADVSDSGRLASPFGTAKYQSYLGPPDRNPCFVFEVKWKAVANGYQRGMWGEYCGYGVDSLSREAMERLLKRIGIKGEKEPVVSVEDRKADTVREKQIESSGNTDSLKAKLKELKQLLDEGLITEEEAAAKRSKLLEDM